METSTFESPYAKATASRFRDPHFNAVRVIFYFRFRKFTIETLDKS